MKRGLYDDIKKHLVRKEHTILIGARQVGKTTILKQLFKESEEVFPAVFINLERKDLLAQLDESPLNILKLVPKQENKRTLVFIDEIQYLQDPTNFLKLLYDDYVNQIKIVATGSSAFYIDKEFKDSLAGRKRIFELSTLNFQEFLEFKGENEILSELNHFRAGNTNLIKSEAILWALMEEYLLFGGYPAVVLENNREEKISLLQDLRDSFIKRDILESGIKNETTFYRLMILLASQSGNLLNQNELSLSLRIPYPEIENYIYVMRKCFHIELVRPFFRNIRKELTKMPKAYFKDLGLRNVLLNYFEPLENRLDKGILLENYIYLHLRNKHSNDKIKYWRTADNNEVDFVIENTIDSGKAIEAKFNAREAKESKYTKFISAYPTYPLEFISWRDPSLLMSI